MQSVETIEATTSPGWGDAPLPKRSAPRGLLPSTWAGREVTLEYTGADGRAESHRCTLLDWCGLGVVVNLAGARTIISWDHVALIELASS